VQGPLGAENPARLSIPALRLSALPGDQWGIPSSIGFATALVSGHSVRVFVLSSISLVAHCVFDTSPADSAVKLVCTTVTFIDVLHVLKTFLIVRHYFVCVYCPKLSRLRGLAKCLQYLLLLRACRVPYRMPSQHLSRSHEAKALADGNNNDDQLQWGSELFAASAPWVVFQLFC
jgi:hypothetical protein